LKKKELFGRVSRKIVVLHETEFVDNRIFLLERKVIYYLSKGTIVS
jgi:hypothetical protein